MIEWGCVWYKGMMVVIKLHFSGVEGGTTDLHNKSVIGTTLLDYIKQLPRRMNVVHRFDWTEREREGQKEERYIVVSH